MAYRPYHLALILLLASLPVTLSQAAPATVTFEKDVRPILKAHCFHCHGEEDVRDGGLDLRLAHFIIKGGDSGPGLVPGNPGSSELFKVLDTAEMPKGKSKLADKELMVIKTWIEQGAKTLRPEPETLGNEMLITEEDRAWWSIQPIDTPTVPTVQLPQGTALPIDAFIAAQLNDKGLEFSPKASPRSLIRRATFNLTGLPPTPEEIAAFEAAYAKDPSAAFSALTDRLLSSESYGERWARHWLDVAGYADSDGYTEKDLERPHAWRYRDYVIRTLNRDVPFDAFVREQLAGDEIAALEKLHANSPTEAERKRYEDLISATGFLRMAPDGSGAQNNLLVRNDAIVGTMTVVSTALYGMTIHCAQCHDHRYDPISQKDYYELRAVFEPGFEPAKWRVPAGRLVSLQTKEEADAAALIEEEAKKEDAIRLAKQNEFIDEVLGKLLLEAEEGQREALKVAYRTVAKERTDEQNKLLAKYPKIRQLSGGSLYLYDTTYKTKHAATLKEMAEKIAAIRAKKPEIRYVHAFNEVPRKPEEVAPTHLFFRGNHESPKEEVYPSDLSVLSAWRQVDIAPNTDELRSTGRRLALARMLTDGEHPLLARVIVNRVWMHHFGRGIVSSPGDFGALGDRPSHPELLDWLASDFMAHGWSLKRLHRNIMATTTWQQASTRDPKRDQIDPDNVYLSRQNVRRIEAESLRDSLLAVSGKLNTKMYGAPIPVMRNTEGSNVVGVDTTDAALRQTGKFISLEGEEFRRSIYVAARRTRPLEMFQTFDAPDMTEPTCEKRPVTTVSPQSLLLMNNSLMREFSQYFAERLSSDEQKDTSSQIKLAWELAYGRTIDEADLKDAIAFVEAQTAFYKANPTKFERAAAPQEKENAAPELLGLAAFCHAVLSANEFLYID